MARQNTIPQPTFVYGEEVWCRGILYDDPAYRGTYLAVVDTTGSVHEHFLLIEWTTGDFRMIIRKTTSFMSTRHFLEQPHDEPVPVLHGPDGSITLDPSWLG